jgi:hypothetical protein
MLFVFLIMYSGYSAVIVAIALSCFRRLQTVFYSILHSCFTLSMTVRSWGRCTLVGLRANLISRDITLPCFQACKLIPCSSAQYYGVLVCLCPFWAVLVASRLKRPSSFPLLLRCRIANPVEKTDPQDENNYNSERMSREIRCISGICASRLTLQLASN